MGDVWIRKSLLGPWVWNMGLFQQSQLRIQRLCAWVAMLAELKVEEHRVGAGHWAHFATILHPLREKEVSHLGRLLEKSSRDLQKLSISGCILDVRATVELMLV